MPEHSSSRGLLLGVLVCSAAGAQGALTIVDPTIAGDTVTLPVHLQGQVAEGVAALDFQLTYDASVLTPVRTETGAAAAAAGKEIQARVLAGGQYVVLMFGLSRSSVAQGEIARIVMNKTGDPEDSSTPVSLENTMFASITGVEIPSQGSESTLLFDDEDDDSPETPPNAGGGITPGPLPAAESRKPTSDASSADSTPGANGGTRAGETPSGLNEQGGFRSGGVDRLSVLRELQTELEAVRSSLDESHRGNSRTTSAPPPAARKLRTLTAKGAPTSGGVDESADSGPEPVRSGSFSKLDDSTGVDSTEAEHLPPSRSEKSGEPGALAIDEKDTVAEEDPDNLAPSTRRLRVQGAVLAVCLAAFAGIYLGRRRLGA